MNVHKHSRVKGIQVLEEEANRCLILIGTAAGTVQGYQLDLSKVGGYLLGRSLITYVTFYLFFSPIFFTTQYVIEIEMISWIPILNAVMASEQSEY